MAEEYKYKVEDIERYRPIVLIPEYSQKKDIGALEETLMKFMGNLGVEKKEREDLSSSLNLENFVQVYSNKYQKALNSATLKDLRNFYSDLFERFYEEKNLQKVNKFFDSSETYENFRKRYEKTQEIAQSKTDNFSKEQKEKAQKELKELNKIIMPIQEFENLRVNTLRKPIEEESLRRKLNNMYEEEQSS